jgi:hypothetical protein
LVWELVPGQLLYRVNISTFSPYTWIATAILATAATTGIEAAVVRWGFKIAVSRRRFAILLAANSISVGAAFISLWIHPPTF